MILKTEKELQSDFLPTKHFLTHANTFSLWRKHFINRKFRFDPKKFSWEQWNEIPFITKKDFLDIGLKTRLIDAKKIIGKNVSRFLLQSTSGTSKSTGPVLFLKNVDTLIEGQFENIGNRMLVLYQGRAISLRDVLAMNRRNRKGLGSKQALVINPFRFDPKMIDTIAEFYVDSVITFPACISYLTSSFEGIEKMFSKIKIAFLSGDFLSVKQFDFITSHFPQMFINLDYIMTEVDTMGVYCTFLRKKYGQNVYHPHKDRIVELVDIDHDGYGEIVITKPFPIELSFIRYRTGDIAKALRKRCPCGSEWTFFLQGRSNMDYIKALGVLITRFEIERVMKQCDTIVEEWRGEVREKQSRGKLLGELTLFVKLRQKSKIFFWSKDRRKLQKILSENIFLTPKKTIEILVEEKKFLPLQIQIVSDFPVASKKVLLKKIVD
jgi:phenylacetate-coenzyme A ligase PaaK-like adenylate-forming protein